MCVSRIPSSDQLIYPYLMSYCQFLCRGSLQITESVQISLKINFSCSDPSSVSMWTKNDENLMIFHAFIGTQSQSKNLGTSRTEFWWFLSKVVPLLSSTPSSVGCIITCVTYRVDFSTQTGYMYKPSWVLTNRGKVQNNLSLKCVCNDPRRF